MMFKKMIVGLLIILCLSLVGIHVVAGSDWKNFGDYIASVKNNCPNYYLFNSASASERSQMCTCMTNLIEKNWYSLAEVHSYLRHHDREPRGNTDLVNGMLRVTYAQCKR